jgi:hypothetical protein
MLTMMLTMTVYVTCVVVLIVVLRYVCGWSRATCLCLAVYELKDMYLRISRRDGT